MSQLTLTAAQKLKEKLDLHETKTNGWTMNRKEAIKAFNLRLLLKDKILESESCTAWFQNLPHFQDAELQSKLEMYAPAPAGAQQDFPLSEQIRPNHENDAVDVDLLNLKYSAIEEVAKRCIVAYILLVRKQYEIVPVAVLSVYNLIEECLEKSYFSSDYALGFWYVGRGLEIAFGIETKIKDEDKDEIIILKGFIQDLDLFYNNFSDQNKVGVLALKQFFIGKMSHTSHEMHLKVIRKMIQLDPGNFEWFHYLYITSRFQRKSVQEDGMPCEEEMHAIQMALSFKEADSDPRILLSYIVCLSEIYRDRFFQGQQGSFKYGDHVFSSTESVIDFIQNKSEIILGIDPTSVRVNHEIAKMFLIFQPRTTPQLQFSKTCIQRALLFHPNSSKANHRMGVFYISAKMKSRDLPSALPYIRKAYEVNKSNTFALEDLLRLYMKDMKRNSTELTSIFDEALSSGYFQKCPKTMSKLLFIKALYALLVGNQSETVDLLIRSFTASEGALEYFRNIPLTIMRYEWYEKVPGEILNGIKKILSNEILQCKDLRQKIKLEKLYEAARDVFLNQESGPLPLNKFAYQSRNIQTGHETYGGIYRDFDALNSIQRPPSSVDIGNWRDHDNDNSNNWRTHHVLEEGSAAITTTANKTHSGGSTSSHTRFNQTSCCIDDNWRSSRANQPDFVNPFNVLGVTQDASKRDIDKAYVSLVKENQSGDLPHDKFVQQQEHMMRINKAWELLQQ